jgi:hypothetical protein
MIIGVAGFAGSGKDTVGKYLVVHYNFEHRSFAAKLKEATAALLDMPLDKVDEYKLMKNVCVELVDDDDIVTTFTFRHFLQRMGTEMGRNVFGEDFWVDMVLPDNLLLARHYQEYVARKIVITDVRFENEASRVRELDGVVIWVETTDATRAARGRDSVPAHKSAMRLDPELIDYTITNDSSLANLHVQIKDVLDDMADRRVTNAR